MSEEEGSPVEPTATSKADKLEAKAARLREKQQARADAAAKRAATATAAPMHARTPIALVAAAVAVILVLVGLTIWQYTRVLHYQHRESARTSALTAAKTYAIDFSSYDYTKLDEQFAHVQSELTGSFKSDYAATAARLKATIVKYRGRATATVQTAGVRSASPHHAVVVVLLDQRVTNTSAKTARIDRNRLEITLTRKGSGRWLMSNLLLK